MGHLAQLAAQQSGAENFPGSTMPLPCAEEMVRIYAAAGVPKPMMTLGLALFGHEWHGVGNLLVPAERALALGRDPVAHDREQPDV